MKFSDKFNKTAVLDFLKNQFLPDDFALSQEPIRFSQLTFTPDRIKEIEYIGESKNLDLKLYIVRHESENDPRVTLSRETFRVMSGLGARRALVVFHSANPDNYRLSLATITLALKGAKTKREYSNPRRYSFFLGSDAKTHTPEQFLSKKVSDFDDLLKRFSIEVVNKEFYNEIAIKFTELVGGKRKVKTRVEDFKPALRLPGMDLSKPQSHIAAQEFAVRLIGRVVFCWFLKKKKSPGGESLLPESVLSSSAMAACDKAGDSYYHSVLENLFFQVLNTEMPERAKEFKKSPYDKIPFLNGGLFEPHDGDFYDFDAATVCSKHLNTLKIPNAWFKGLLDILETYNFTIDENTSVDVELAVDPEMLGRIFENLLAEINPETGETARKSTGSYYTPRPIVEYMVDESLKAYLKSKTGMDEERLSDLLSYSESSFPPPLVGEGEGGGKIEAEKGKIITALDEVKIIDPACGSGAFPMGMLQKIVLVLQKVDPDSKKWLAKLMDGVPDATAKEALRKKLEGESDLWNYTRKLGVIRKSVYGVDIQPIAVEISKLRFFLSLVVDEKVDDKKKNRNIEPLPNLEFKFVCANTLIGLPKEEAELFDDLRDIDALKNLRDKYFTASGHTKLKVENDFLSTQHKMLMRSLGWGKADTKAMKLSQWEPFKNKSTGWFHPEWMFGLKGGFDIVIANPPYMTFSRVTGSGSKNSESDTRIKKILTALYPNSAEYKISTYAIFMNLGINLLAEQGVLCFITPETFLVGRYSSKLRQLILDTCKITRLLLFTKDFWESGTIGLPTISFLVKEANPQQRNENDVNAVSCRSLQDFLVKKVSTYKYPQQYFHSTPYKRFRLVFSKQDFVLLNKIEKGCIFARDVIEMHVGVRPKIGYDKIQSTKGAGEPWKKGFVKGNEIIRFSAHWDGNYICIDPKLLWGGGFDSKIVSQDKILMRKTGNDLIAAIDTHGFYHLDILHSIICNQPDYDLRYLVALFNSKCINFYYKLVTLSFNRVLAQVNIETIENIPIKKPSDVQKESIISIVDKISTIKQKNPDAETHVLETQIDQLFYQLYNLTPEEIKIVEAAKEK